MGFLRVSCERSCGFGQGRWMPRKRHSTLIDYASGIRPTKPKGTPPPLMGGLPSNPFSESYPPQDSPQQNQSDGRHEESGDSAAANVDRPDSFTDTPSIKSHRSIQGGIDVR